MGETAVVLDLLERIDGIVSVVGSMNADYTVTAERLPNPGETITGGPLRILPGGKSGNQAAAAARIGADARMFGAVGSDGNADFLLGELHKAGVDTTHVRHVPGASGTTVITVDARGENTIVYSPGSNAQVDVDYIDASRDAITASNVLGLCLESPIAAVTEAARIGHETGVTVLLNNSPFMATLPDELIANTDILLVNEHEMVQMFDIDEPDNGDWSGFDWTLAWERMRACGFDRAIVTLGGDGSVVLDATVAASGLAASPIPPITRIAPVRVDAVDTTGCGDAFMGTVLAGLASGFALREAAQLASYVSAYAATGYGAQASYGTTAQIRTRFGV
ncbi:sugar kinase [Bifidobacterium ramosum]|uniref:Ribokinase n=1 Tax=Bifidobacterium ramosum TaxID=1798158 RepID=A0A6L4X2F0_9BIFI|nr:ribokinase [Bifidobacterium ramosum]KAB8288804.1 sugar kinase [Bifidobacterium ramosum]NEG71333.1 ribokinase [Bifidobacterium ramosum]